MTMHQSQHFKNSRPYLSVRQMYPFVVTWIFCCVALVQGLSLGGSKPSWKRLSVNGFNNAAISPLPQSWYAATSLKFSFPDSSRSSMMCCWASKKHSSPSCDTRNYGSEPPNTRRLTRNQRRFTMRSSMKLSQSNNNDHVKDSHVAVLQRQQQQQSRRPRGWRHALVIPSNLIHSFASSSISTLSVAAVLMVSVLCAASPAAHAAAASIGNLDLSAISGGATALALSTSQLWDSLTVTGFYQAFSLVFLSEIGDKTFFIAGLLAMKTSRFISFIGSMAALAAMTLVSVFIGQIFHAVPAGFADGIPLDDVAAVLAFAFFGIKTLKEALEIDGGSTGSMDEELAEAQETVEGSSTIKQVTPWAQIASIFALVFAAEFGDRSFLSTIALSAAQNPVSVAGGAIAAHAAATGIAVSGGSFVAKMLSEKVIGLIGGTLFLVFAVTTALGIF